MDHPLVVKSWLQSNGREKGGRLDARTGWVGAAQKLIVREVTFEEENGARKRRENRRGVEGESRKMEVRARGGERRVYKREREKEKKR